MDLLGLYLVAAALLVVAGAMKAARPDDTARALAAGLRWWPRRGGRAFVRAGAGAEAVLGLVALAWPARPVAALVACSYAAFGAFVLHARSRGGALATCGCFGSPDTPPTLSHVAADVVLLAGAVALVIAGPSGAMTSVLAHQYHHGVPLLAASALAAWLTFLVLSPLARLGALRAMAPYVPGGRS